MWSEGVIGVPSKTEGKPTAVHYWVKHYENPSKYGIENGRISKLLLKIDGKVVANYDRGWDIRPQNEAAEIALQILLYQYDGRNEK